MRERPARRRERPPARRERYGHVGNLGLGQPDSALLPRVEQRGRHNTDCTIQIAQHRLREEGWAARLQRTDGATLFAQPRVHNTDGAGGGTLSGVCGGMVVLREVS